MTDYKVQASPDNQLQRRPSEPDQYHEARVRLHIDLYLWYRTVAFLKNTSVALLFEQALQEFAERNPLKPSE